MGRSAVAATLISFVIFTSLLVANSALYSSENSSLGAAVLSAVQVRERAYSEVLLGLSAYASLAGAEGYLQSNPLDCTSPEPYLDSMAGSQRDSGVDEGISYTAGTSWSYAPAPTSGGGSAGVAQFGGFEAGDLNLEIRTTMEESYDGGLPSYSVQATEAAHLPIPLASIISDCLGALSDLGGALASLQSCNSTGVDSAVGAADSSYPLLASYSVGASATPAPSGCSVDYWISTTESGLEGVSGPFQLTVVGEGSLATSVNAGSPPSSA